MSDGIMIAIITTLATIFTVGITQLVTYLIAKNKKLPQNEKITADASLSRGDLAEKYQKIANKQADENILLREENDKKEAENEALMGKIEELRQEMKVLDDKRTQEIDELRREFESWKNYAIRLNMQVMSWGLVPVPFSVKDAIEKGLSLGDIGRVSIDQSNKEK
jgi:hypothetical protein